MHAYLEVLPPAHRYAFARLRLGGHGLGIELGRYESPQIPPEARYCRFCRSSRLVEDEVHILGQCYGSVELFEEREELVTALNVLDSAEIGRGCTLTTLQFVPVWDSLLNSQAPGVVELIGRYVYRCLKITHAKKWRPAH